MVIYRLGSYIGKHLDKSSPDWYKEIIANEVAEGDIQEVLRVLGALINIHTRLLQQFCQRVIAKAREKGLNCYVYASCCTKPKGGRCGTCLGKYKNHYPRFKVRTGEWGERNQGWKSLDVQTRELTDFLRQFVSEEELQDFYYVAQMRVDYIIFYNYFLLRAEHDGLIGVDAIER
ncbi:MAG: hypothetical protein H3Z53_05660 [archaeon]|nr:hypothetical protein [archaeon]MCP8313843.1 hypothetical protein [archaeon]